MTEITKGGAGPSTGINPFDRIRHIDPDGMEFWKGRELAKELGYPDYRFFCDAMDRAKIACSGSGHSTDDHFVDVPEMVEIGSGAQRETTNVWLSRYACYLVVQNADSKKPVVALGQTYFAIQTRRQEMEDDRRLLLRNEMTEHNKKLAGAAKNAGVVEPKDFAIFQNAGYKGMYAGKTMQEIKRDKGLKRKQQILDHMGSTELAANLFRATQTEEKLSRENIQGNEKANRAHYDVGKKVRQTMGETGGVMPEDLPVAESIKAVEKRKRLEGTNDPKRLSQNPSNSR